MLRISRVRRWFRLIAPPLLLGVIVPVRTVQAMDLPVIGKIDFYGRKTVSEAELHRAIQIKAGDPIPISFPRSVTPEQLRKKFEIPEGAPLPANEQAIEAQLRAIKGVIAAQVTAVCCEADGTATLFVGIEESTQNRFAYRKLKTTDALLSAQVLRVYDAFTEAMSAAVQNGTAQEDDSEGHALFQAEALKPLQNQFIEIAARDAKILEHVLLTSKDAKHRAVAAMIIGYSTDKKQAAKILSQAVHDPDELVRNNATRSIGTIAALASRRPDLGIAIDPTPLSEMLHSLSWKDRNKATMVLMNLTLNPSPELLKQLRSRTLPQLVEMARWRDSHSLGPLLLLGRTAGMKDPEVEELWKSGRREEVIARAEKGSN